MTALNYIIKALKEVSDTPRLDAQYFYDYYKGCPTDEQISDFIQRRKSGEPVSKIIGLRGFWKRDFYVSRDVLDPRPDSETLIEAVLDTFKEQNQCLSFLDIGTGSGCLLLTLLDEYPCAIGTGIDKSEAALIIAQKNDTNNRAKWIQKDFYALDFCVGMEQYDVIISNPPYIPHNDIALLDNEVRLYDPLLALDGGLDGLDAYRRLSDILPLLLKENGVVFFEIGIGQENDVIQIMSNRFRCVEMYKDLGGIVRILMFRKK
ncbi:MAG: peptide chain release factor N(5)-glutamine methyltransferase [Alphaproteobacteria bacterium]|nr:peptide chain release factor N(5)-glutamine methyltransferase [Alphaproteobacteria bacterium]